MNWNLIIEIDPEYRHFKSITIMNHSLNEPTPESSHLSEVYSLYDYNREIGIRTIRESGSVIYTEIRPHLKSCGLLSIECEKLLGPAILSKIAIDPRQRVSSDRPVSVWMTITAEEVEQMSRVVEDYSARNEHRFLIPNYGILAFTDENYKDLSLWLHNQSCRQQPKP